MTARTARAAKTLTRRTKAITLVPLALLSGVWTASLVTTSASASSADKSHNLPDGTKVPANAIQAPASVPVPGVVAPAVPNGAEDSVVSGASSNGIPSPALSAYQRAAQIIDAADKTCNIPWELIAAIGRVESDHGRYGGNTLTQDGVSQPGIYGIPLDGKNGTQVVHDTDGGQYDHDAVYDRAVGPMQFIPSTWQVVKVDANGDGKRNPQDINDASLATAVYLCSGSDNLGTRKGQESAVYRYNHSQNYVNLVLRIMEAYSSGNYTAVPSGTYGGSSFSSSGYSAAINHSYKAAKQRKVRQAKIRQQQIANGGSSASGGSGSGSGTGVGGTGTGGSGGTGTGGVTLPGGGSTGGTGGSGSGGNTLPKLPIPTPSLPSVPSGGGGGTGGGGGGTGGGGGGTGGGGGGVKLPLCSALGPLIKPILGVNCHN